MNNEAHNNEQKNTLEFSYNWNGKLDCETFTTIRLSNRFEIGQKVEIWLKKECKGQAEIINKLKMENIGKINEWIARLDTGYSAEECRKLIKAMYPRVTGWANKPIYMYLIKYDESPVKKKIRELLEKTINVKKTKTVPLHTLEPGKVFQLGGSWFTVSEQMPIERMTRAYISGNWEWVLPNNMDVEPVTEGGE